VTPVNRTANTNGSIILDTPDGIRYFQLAQWKYAIQLESLGMRHSSGRSVTAHAKRQLGIRGNRDKVLARIEELMNELEARKRGQA
jgi:hypothetical protein